MPRHTAGAPHAPLRAPLRRRRAALGGATLGVAGSLWASACARGGPPPFGLAPTPAPALAVAPDGHRLFDWDGASGALAVADTSTVRLTRVTAPAPGTGPDGPSPSLAAGRGGRLFLGAGSTVRVLDARSLEVRETWTLPGAVRGLRPSRDAARLYAALPDAIVRLDTATGRVHQPLAAPGIAALLHVTPQQASTAWAAERLHATRRRRPPPGSARRRGPA